MDESQKPARAWLRQQTKLGRKAAMPVVGLGLVGIALAIGQALCLAAGLSGTARWWPLAGFAVLAICRAALIPLVEQASFNAGAAARRRLRSDALSRMLDAGPSLLRRDHSAVLAATLVDRIEAIDGLFARWLPAVRLAVAGPVVVGLVVLLLDPWAGLILFGCGLLVPFAMALSGMGAAAASRRQFTAMTRLQARFVDRIRGISTLVLAGRAEDEAQALARAAEDLRVRTMKVLRVAFLSSAALDCAAALALVTIALRYGAEFAAWDLARIGTPLAVLLLVAEFFAPLRAFSAAYQDRMHAQAAAEALTALPPASAAQALPVRTVEASGVGVVFEDVSLTWDSARGPALDHLSFRVPAGETLVLVGPSGAGKSTIMEILLGFARPDSGRVTLNGADIADLVPQALARLSAWIGQRPVLFAGTVRDNIRFARPEASETELADAVVSARLDSVLAALPDGLDTLVGEGGYGLSGGQAQRVAIARAFLKNAPLLLLDEPTAHLDPATESEVLESLRRLTLGRTVILASHSAAAHAFAGRRVDLRNGRAVGARGGA